MSRCYAPTIFSLRELRRQRGLSLIELMVALSIGALLIAGAIVVYLQGQSTHRSSDATARLQEIGRFAFNVLEPDVRLAGFWGRAMAADAITNAGAAIGPNTCGANWLVNSAVPIEGSNDSYGLTCPGTTPVTWADTLVLRRASVSSAPLTADMLQLQANRETATFFTNGVLPSGFVAATSETRDVVPRAYYISQVASPGAGDLVKWSLRRRSIAKGSGGVPAWSDVEVVQGVQDIQVQFGIDTDGNGSADRYVDPSLAPTGLVVAARIWILVVGDEREQGYKDSVALSYANVTRNSGSSPIMFNDSRRRMLFMKTIQIRNART